jgi:uncharacterized repeat protein (TIGR04076 family)
MEKEKTLRAEVIEQKGRCAAGHKKGDVLRISTLRSCNLCGSFYHGIFPSLQTYEYGGRLPWWRGEDLVVTCPDPANPVTLRITRDEA